MNITVYCGSKPGNHPAYRQAAKELGRWIASGGHTLVYGGGNVGLMGLIADTVLAEGGRVIGIIPEFLMAYEVGHTGIHSLEVVETMSQRKNRMMELGDAFVAMPGGTGTLEEIAEVMSMQKLGKHNKPCFFLNIDGFYEPMRTMLAVMVQSEFLLAEEADRIRFIESSAELEAGL